jgi:hypothetical protein
MRRKRYPIGSLIVFLLILGAYFMLNRLLFPAPETTAPPSSSGSVGAVVAGTPGPLPEMRDKPQPQEITFQGCPPEGDGGDPALNRLKNRVDEGNYIPVQFNAILELSWPPGVEQRARADWSAADAAAVARYEGLPVAVEGYLAGARETSPEAVNCHGKLAEDLDWHIWLVPARDGDPAHALVVKATPRVRARHPGWTMPVMDKIVKSHQHVRISGWLMLDPEHPEEVGKTRGTIWEIHPVMRIEGEEQGRWVALE